MALLQHGIAKSGVAAFYSQEIGGSLRFNMAGGPYLSRTMGTATDGKKCTISFWVKKNDIVNSTTTARFMSAYSGTGNQFHMQWGDGATGVGDQWNVNGGENSSNQGLRMTTAPLRDPSAWYHCVWSYNSTSGSESVVLYINGVAQTSSYTDAPTTNLVTSATKSGTVLYIGYINSSSLDIQLAEMHLIDGQALDPTSFGEFKSGAWIPKAYEGLYGNNGFYFDFTSSNYSNPNMLDSSGNSNNFAASGGIDTHDFVLDSPTNNFATLNPSFYFGGSIDDGNLKHTSGGSWVGAPSTIAMSSGKWYAEFIGRDANNISVGVMATGGDTQKNLGTSNLGYMGKYSDSYGWVNNFGTVYKANNDVTSSYGSAPSNDDVIMVAFDADSGELYTGKNGTWFNSSNPATSTSPMYSSIPMTNTAYYFASGLENANGYWNFGQDSTFGGATSAGGNADENGYGDFKYSVPSGYLALCTANLPTPAADPASDVEPRDYFEAFLWEGNGGGQQVGDVIKKPADTTTISNSLIFNQPDTAYLSRTPSASTTTNSATTFTVSCWFKPTGHSNDYQTIWMASTGDATVDRIMLRYNSAADDNKLLINNDNGFGMTTTAAFKDTSRWYHIVVAVDTRSSVTQSDRVKVWVDGVLQTLTVTTAASADETTKWNQNYPHKIGDSTYYSGRNLDGYLAEFHNIDGTAYEASDFGNFDANGIWIPKAVTGLTYGDNGFYLDFSDNTSTTTLGADSSGNGNDWTLNNFATTDQVADSPTNNFMTMSPTHDFSNGTFSEGNLKVTTGTSEYGCALSSFILRDRGKYFCEITQGSGSYTQFGCASTAKAFTTTLGLGSGTDSFCYVQNDGSYRAGGGNDEAYGATWTSGDVIGMALNLDDHEVTFYKNGTSQGTLSIIQENRNLLENTQYHVAISDNDAGGGTTCTFNFGQKTFYGTDGAGTLPTGFTAISENNITVDDQNLESPDLVWVKNRDNADNHYIYDEVRGIAKAWASDDYYAEIDTPRGLIDFNTNGFTVGDDGGVNRANQSYVAWTWKANGSGSDSTSQMGGAGTGASATTSANSDLGIGITKYYIGSSPDTYKSIPHGLGATPEFIIVKNLDSGQWPVVHHHKLGANGYLNLGLNTNAAQSDISYFRTGYFDSTHFYVGGANETGVASTNFISYCFVGKEGFSKFGEYKDSSGSNYNTDSPFVYCGFRPAWIFIKSTSGGRPFVIYDNKRSPENPAILWLQPDTTHGDQSDATNHDIDFMANGFKVKGGSGDVNTTGETYIFAAFAEMPFKYATAR